ncbi:hypothetical protein BDZ94DRAFT_298536 [Collybia nuda]|uniref:Uncharacterized protein n=1 Tax=Collybia nuda TaxID=64659 RepID=A0A9P5YAH8_9AGAR|nr:hypothetical protein BDZ94DRAFT_298536 [Collybia nuda]
MKLFRGLEAILKDIGVDTALPDASGTSAPNSISDLQGVDYLAEAILAGITTWLVQIDPEDKPLSWWEGFRVIVKLLRSPKAEGLLPLSWRQASASHVQEWFPVSALDYEEYDILVDNENDPDDTLEIGTPMFSSKPNESSIKPVQEAPTVSQTESEPDESRLFSSADAAIMADAFRKMLQKQDTIESPLEGDIFDATSGIIKDPKGKEKINETTDDASPTGSIPSNEGPFSGADAAIMADAFRKMLRKPDFSERPVEEGDGIDGAEDLERKEEFFSTPLLAGDLQNDEVISSRDAALVADAFRKVRRKPDLPEIPVVERDTSGAVEGPEKGAKRECSIQ